METKIQPDEIMSIIQDKIENFDLDIDISETGKVISVADGVVNVYGLNNVMSSEIVEFDNGERGMPLEALCGFPLILVAN